MRASQRELTRVYRAEARFVWRLGIAFGVEMEALDDFVHDVFLAAHRRWADYDSDVDVRSWLYGIARLVGANHRRGRGRRERRRTALRDVSAGVAAPPPRPDVAAELRERAEALERFLESLDPDKREVFYLVEVVGMRGSEVAALSGTNPNTVAARLRAARHALARFFAPVPERRAAAS